MRGHLRRQEGIDARAGSGGVDGKGRDLPFHFPLNRSTKRAHFITLRSERPTMAVNTEQEEEKPLDPATERVRRKMVRLLVVSIGVMMVGLMAVLAAIVYKVGSSGSRAGGEVANGGVPIEPGFEGRVDLPQGAEIVSTALDGDNILLQLRLAQGGRQLVIHSLSRNRIIARLMLD